MRQIGKEREKEEQDGYYQPFFRAKRLLSRARTRETLNWTYSRSRSSWLSFCISSKSSSFRSSSNRPLARPTQKKLLAFIMNKSKIGVETYPCSVD